MIDNIKLGVFCDRGNCCKGRALSKCDISLHSGIGALCSGADTWSPALCQRGLTTGLRCNKRPPYVSRHYTFQLVSALMKNIFQNIRLNRSTF